jgi:ubiquitin C-terminal hydrolase
MGGLGGGHYTANAIVQSPFEEPSETARWCCFNDSAVTDGAPGLSSSSAYLLFYEKIPAPRDKE